ncbi:MlaD family protein [Conexibacter sp. DBS9H8]|uniref:MlaD family protein n=1 Tax=Conexibacter sp. DBS9H8 TaxID=2937801 RepID=UPI00200F0088|nr:MlaD family protein [Conexibacter sp. DBS9H8]
MLVVTALAAVAAVFVLLSSWGGNSRVVVDAVFDTADGMVSGQLVKIAGARVGTVTAVRLEPGPVALLQMSIDRRFAPFRADASCQILPEGFISENYVECDPGSRTEPPLAAGPNRVPTVPLSHTAVPVSLQEVLNIFSLPVDQRLKVLIDELGIGTAGRGESLNAILQSANPALTQAQRVLSILDQQRSEIARAVGQSDVVLSQLAREDRGVRDFVDRAAAVLRTTAAHRAALADSVRNLPAMLDATDRAMGSLGTVAATAAPLLADLRAAAPGLTLATHTIPAFAQTGLSAIRPLRDAAGIARRAIPAVEPVVRHLRTFGVHAGPVTHNLSRLLVNLRDTGAFEAVLNLAYKLATMSAAYDPISHMGGVVITLQTRCLLGWLRAPLSPAAGCSHAYTAPGRGTVPVNAPSAGPQLQSSSVWGQATAPTGTPAASAAPASPRFSATQLNALLRYLLR